MPTQVADQETIHDSRFDHETAMKLAAEEYSRFARVLAGLAAEDWQVPTSCPGWTVRDMAGHTLGMAEFLHKLLSDAAFQEETISVVLQDEVSFVNWRNK